MPNKYFKYLNVTPFEERWGIYVTTVGYSKVDPHDQYPNEQHPQSHHLTWNRGRILNDFYIVFISKGKGIFGSALTEPSEVLAGTCFFLYPGVLHRYKPDRKSGWEEYWVGFNGFYIEQLFNNGIFDRQNTPVYLGLNKDLLVMFQYLIDAVKSSLPGYPQQIAGTTIQILGLINEILLHAEYSNDPVGRLISKAKFIMQESFEKVIDMEELARELPMGYSSFRKAFKRITGKSPNQYQLDLRLNRAKELLINTALNISEIANQTGYDSVFYFSKIFKKKNGVSPNFYRNYKENL